MDIKDFKKRIKEINSTDGGVRVKVLSKDYQQAVENNKLRPEWWPNQKWAEFSYGEEKLYLISKGDVDILITDKESGNVIEHHTAPIKDSSIITEDDDIMLILEDQTDYVLAFDETPTLVLMDKDGNVVHSMNYHNNVITALFDHLDSIKKFMEAKPEEEPVKEKPKSEAPKEDVKEDIKEELKPVKEAPKETPKEAKATPDNPIKDSGKKEEFSTGAVRDIQTGKGRCDLLPLDIVAEFMTSKTDKDVLELFAEFQDSGDYKCLVNAAAKFADEYFADRETAVLEYAIQLENGAIKYGPRNWQKGIPLDRYVDSGIRHYMKHLRGDNDERHDRAALWNMLCGAWTKKNKIGE